MCPYIPLLDNSWRRETSFRPWSFYLPQLQIMGPGRVQELSELCDKERNPFLHSETNSSCQTSSQRV